MIGNVRDPLELRLRDVAEAAVDAVAGAVDPYVDRPEGGDDRIRGFHQGGTVGYICLCGGRARAAASTSRREAASPSAPRAAKAQARQPRRANRAAVHRPMPDDPPVMTTTRATMLPNADAFTT